MSEFDIIDTQLYSELATILSANSFRVSGVILSSCSFVTRINAHLPITVSLEPLNTSLIINSQFIRKLSSISLTSFVVSEISWVS